MGPAILSPPCNDIPLHGKLRGWILRVLLTPAILDCPEFAVYVLPAACWPDGFAEMRAASHFFDRLYGEGIRSRERTDQHTMLVHEMGILTREEH